MNSEEASQLRATILNVANKFLEAYTLTIEGKIKEARSIIYELDRFDVGVIYHKLIDLEQGKKDELKEEPSDPTYPKPTIDS